MREIKFRAWDAEREQMFTHPKWVEFRAKHGVITAHNYNRASNVQTLELMQFTGLTDKNGVEIYEGDIVKFKWLGEYTGVIKYEDCGFGLSYNANDEQMNVAMRRFYFDKNAEVIGNIHENPELLEAKS